MFMRILMPLFDALEKSFSHAVLDEIGVKFEEFRANQRFDRRSYSSLLNERVKVWKLNPFVFDVKGI
ncbi:hypothetical protein UCREL1_787 [Eutypa lata UCREL1]|uniref:Uncharacterized protein n=1 Tax=Eutypa lata (strain UCR-EL1) TaxID=1287681 RepID=M7TZS5_EUTLA|nr:hypothetical protein UCREL1_787 [Eutypa lata UCREL1]